MPITPALKILNNSDPGTSTRAGGNDFDTIATWLNNNWSPYSYVIEKTASGSNYNARNSSTGAILSGPTTAQTAIQAAIDDLSTGFAGDVNRHKGAIFIRSNAFYTGLDLTLKSGIWLVGEGQGTVLTGKVTVQDTADSCGMYNLNIGQTSADHCLYLNGARSFTAQNCVFYLNNTTLTKFPVLIDGGTAFGSTNTFIKCQILSKGHGLKQVASATTKYTNTTSLYDCYVLYNAGSTATGGQIGLNFDGDGVEKNIFCRNVYLEGWDTAVALDEGQCHLEGMYVDVVNTAGIDVTQAAIDQENILIDVSTASTTTQPLLVLGGRKFYAVSPHYSMTYDARSLNFETAFIQKYILKNKHDVFIPYGLAQGHGAAGQGLFVNATGTSVSSANSGNYTLGHWHRYTGNATDLGPCGLRYTGASFTFRGWNPGYFAKMSVFDKANTRGWFGLFSVSTAPTGNDWLNAAYGCGIGWKSGDANFSTINNDGSGASVYTDTGIAFASNTPYTIEIRVEDSTPRFGYSINQSTMTFVTTELPTQTVALFPHFQIEQAGAATARLLDRFLWYVKPKNT